MTAHAPSARFAALVVADAGGPGRAAAEAAVAATGGRVLSCVRWDEVTDELPRRAGSFVLVLEAEGVAPDLLERALPRLDSVAAALDLPVMASFGLPSLDLVTASVLTARAEFLCEPGLADRAAALAVFAGAGGPRLNEPFREDEGTRLRQLNDEVARIADVLARLAARDGQAPEPGAAVADRRQGFGLAPAPDADHAPTVDAADVRRAIRARRLREQFFPRALLEDPGWDMLLDLFAAELERSRVSVSSLCIAAAVAPTTALRWITKMTDAGLLAREADPFDRRRAYMVLTPRAATGMRAYFDAARRANTAPA